MKKNEPWWQEVTLLYGKYIKMVIDLFLYQISVLSEKYWKYAMSIYSSK